MNNDKSGNDMIDNASINSNDTDIQSAAALPARSSYSSRHARSLPITQRPREPRRVISQPNACGHTACTQPTCSHFNSTQSTNNNHSDSVSNQSSNQSNNSSPHSESPAAAAPVDSSSNSVRATKGSLPHRRLTLYLSLCEKEQADLEAKRRERENDWSGYLCTYCRQLNHSVADCPDGQVLTNDTFHVKEILAHCGGPQCGLTRIISPATHINEIVYLVRWDFCRPPNDLSWEPESNLQSVSDLVQAYWFRRNEEINNNVPLSLPPYVPSAPLPFSPSRGQAADRHEACFQEARLHLQNKRVRPSSTAPAPPAPAPSPISSAAHSAPAIDRSISHSSIAHSCCPVGCPPC